LGMFRHPWHIEWATRKLCTLKGLSALWQWAKSFTTIQQKQAMLTGLEKSLVEQSQEYTPLWRALLYTLNNGEPTLVQRTQEIFARLGWRPALQALQDQLKTGQGTVEERVRCLSILTQKPNDDLLKTVVLLMNDTSLRSQAIKSLARFDSDEVHQLLVKRYATSSPSEKQDILATLTTRPRYARALLDALDAKVIPGTDVLAPTVVALRQLSAMDIKKRVGQRWGTGSTPAALKERIARLQNQLTPTTLKLANVKNGRLLFDKHCATCHKLFGEGQSVGPELTGAQRMNLDYLLENTVTPNAIVPQDYRASTFVMNNGQVITGMITAQQGEALTIQTATEKLVINKVDIESRQQTEKSLMPEGLLDQLSISEIRDLIGYLSSPQQVGK
jgi:putative heme-binding domain-containing protein